MARVKLRTLARATIPSETLRRLPNSARHRSNQQAQDVYVPVNHFTTARCPVDCPCTAPVCSR